jgi:hypothetical protein
MMNSSNTPVRVRILEVLVAAPGMGFVYYRLAYPVADLLTVARTLLVGILESTHKTLSSTVSR